jgi:NADPH-dependent 2,4-dienoyl-CoA reductase/sulfur reductase-like enzyme
MDSASAAGVAVVGGSVAGIRCARGLRSAGYDRRVVVLEAENAEPYDRPPLSKGFLATDAATAPALVREGLLAAAGIELRRGVQVTGLDAAEGRLRWGDHEDVFDHVVVATGAVPRLLPGIEASPRVGVLRNAESARQLREHLRPGAHLVVVGGGYLGLEAAASARTRGVEVTVLEAGPRILGRGAPDALALRIAAVHHAHGVTLRSGAAVVEIDSGRDAVELRLMDGSELRAGYVLVAIGADPDVGWLDGSGVELADGVICDERMQALPGRVLAIGDCASFVNPLYGRRMRLEHWTSAGDQAGYVARLLAGRSRSEGCGVLPYVWSDQYATHLQSTGVAGSQELALDLADGGLVVLYLDDGVLTGGASLGAQALMLRLRNALRCGPVEWSKVENSVLQNVTLDNRRARS